MKLLIGFLLTFSVYSDAGIVWAWRSDNASYYARYTSKSSVPSQFGAGTITYDTDATAIGGNSLNMDQGSTATRMLCWDFHGVHTAKPISILVRFKNSADVLAGFFKLGTMFDYNTYSIYQNSAAYQILMFNNTGATIRNASTGVTTVNNAWVDMVLTWDGTTTSNALKFYIDGSVTNATASQTAPTTGDHSAFCLGGITSGVPNGRSKFNEVVIWDEVIDPSSVTLTSGSGSLNGASRTAFVSVGTLNGYGASSGGGGGRDGCMGMTPYPKSWPWEEAIKVANW